MVISFWSVSHTASLEIFFLHENCPVLPLYTSCRGFFVIPLITLVSKRWSPSCTNSKAPATGHLTGTGSFSANIILSHTKYFLTKSLTYHDVVFPGCLVGELN